MSTANAETSAVSADAEPQWLSAEEKDAWKALLMLVLQLPGTLDGQLQRDSNLTLFEYVTLSALSMAPEFTLRMSELARLSNGSPSRLSNVVKRFEHRGWVHREPDPCNGRCTVATLTPAGYDVVLAAAPGHVEAVRRYVIEPLTANQIRTVTAVGRRIQARLSDGGQGLGLSERPRPAEQGSSQAG